MENITIIDGSSAVEIVTSGSPGVNFDLLSNDDEDLVLLSAATYNEASAAMSRLMYFLQVLGIILNVVNAAVLTRRSMRSPTTSFLVALSVLQLSYVTLLLVQTVYHLFRPKSFTDLFFLAFSIYVSNYALSCLRRGMLALHCLVSVDRLLAVLVPLKAKHTPLATRPWVFIIAAILLVFLVNVARNFKLEIFKLPSPANGTSQGYSYRYTDVYLAVPDFFNYMGIVLKAIFEYLPLVLLAVVNVSVLLVLKASSGRRMQIASNVDKTANRKRDMRMTVTILVSTLIFVLLCLPLASNCLASNAIPESYGPSSGERYLFRFLQQLGGLCQVLAFSTDFFTYVALSSAYRNTLLRMLRIKAAEPGVVAKGVSERGTEVTSPGHVNDWEDEDF